MTLARRLQAVERATRSLGLHERCHACGFPDQSGDNWIVLLKEGEPDLGTCAACGRSVDHEGRTVGSPRPDGSMMLLTIRLAPRPEATRPA